MEQNVVMRVENISKRYNLGLVGTGTLSKDLNVMWAAVRGKPHPYKALADLNDRTQISKSGAVWALKDINLEVKKGEVLGIIGRNGAGKSTLLKILSQITSPSEGRIEIEGRVASMLEVGTGMHPEMTARQNIYLNGSILGMSRREIKDKMEDIIEFAGIAKYIDTPIKRFSSGMQVRLGFSIAAFLEPEILIVDEVLAVGDAEFQKKAIGKMQDVSREGSRTVIFVSHNMASIQNLCTRAVLLENGEISFNSNVEETIATYIKGNLKGFSDVGDLSVKKRSGSGELNFISFRTYIPKSDISVSSGISGQPFYIELDYRAKINLDNVIFALAIYSGTSKVYYGALRSDCVNQRFSVSKGDGKITFVFDKLPFTEGAYSFNVTAQTGFGVIEWIEDAGTFDVINGDYYGNGILPASGRQGVLLDFKLIQS